MAFIVFVNYEYIGASNAFYHLLFYHSDVRTVVINQKSKYKASLQLLLVRYLQSCAVSSEVNEC